MRIFICLILLGLAVTASAQTIPVDLFKNFSYRNIGEKPLNSHLYTSVQVKLNGKELMRKTKFKGVKEWPVN